MRISPPQKNLTFTSRLYSHRILVPISQTELAKELGISRQTLIAIEKGTAQPSLFTALRIAEYFRTSVEKLFSFR